MAIDQKRVKHPRRGRDWGVVGVGDYDEYQIKRFVDSRMLEDDDEAVLYVMAVATTSHDDVPDEVREECRAAVREIVNSW